MNVEMVQRVKSVALAYLLRSLIMHVTGFLSLLTCAQKSVILKPSPARSVPAGCHGAQNHKDICKVSGAVSLIKIWVELCADRQWNLDLGLGEFGACSWYHLETSRCASLQLATNLPSPRTPRCRRRLISPTWLVSAASLSPSSFYDPMIRPAQACTERKAAARKRLQM